MLKYGRVGLLKKEFKKITFFQLKILSFDTHTDLQPTHPQLSKLIIW